MISIPNHEVSYQVDSSEQPVTMSTVAWNLPFVINLGNSIIGVVVLAMPFCFQKCGILLGALTLLFCTWLTLVSCRLLIKAGVASRRGSYSFLAYYTHGATGKFIVELSMIGLQIGTLVAQVVIIGDLGPAILSKWTGLENNSNLRTGLILFLCLFVGLPLGLLKNLRSLSGTSTMCILFYGVFVFYVVSLSLKSLWAGTWYSKVYLWRPEGLFQCLPIFSFAFGCQTQLFILYDALPEPSVKHVDSIVKSAVNMCAVAYLVVGFFGYVALCDEEISGDIITHFPLTIFSDGLKLCFVVSIAVTFPLIIFPCRSSLYTLLFPHKHKSKDDVMEGWNIPEFHFKVITAIIVMGAMTIGILVPNVEFVLAMNGATTGTLMCFVFPALFYLRVMSSSSDSKNLNIAKVVVIFGLTILLLSTYANITTQKKTHGLMEKTPDLKNEEKLVTDSFKVLPKDDEAPKLDLEGIEKNEDEKADHRHEPPNPKEPENSEIDGKKLEDVVNDEGEDQVKKDIDDTAKEKKSNSEEQGKIDDDGKGKNKTPEAELKVELEKKEKELIQKEKDLDEKMKLEDEKLKEKEKETEEKQQELLKQLEQQQAEQKQLLVEQKQILEELKIHKEEQHEKQESQNVDDKLIQGPDQPNAPLQGVIDSQNAQQILDDQRNVPVQQGRGQQNLPLQGQGQLNELMQGQGQPNVPAQGQQNIPVQGQQNVPAQGQQNVPAQGQQIVPVQGQQIVPVQEKVPQNIPVQAQGQQGQLNLPAQGQGQLILPVQGQGPLHDPAQGKNQGQMNVAQQDQGLPEAQPNNPQKHIDVDLQKTKDTIRSHSHQNGDKQKISLDEQQPMVAKHHHLQNGGALKVDSAPLKSLSHVDKHAIKDESIENSRQKRDTIEGGGDMNQGQNDNRADNQAVDTILHNIMNSENKNGVLEMV